REAGETGGARVLVLSASRKAFCAGVDISDHIGDSARPTLEVFHRIIRELWSYRLPTVSLLQGPALGGGCELALSCDIVVATENATLGQPEITVGVFPPPAAVLFPRLCGLARAKELLLTGRVISAEEAYRLGLISKVVKEGELDNEQENTVKALAQKSLPVLMLTRKAVVGSLGVSLDEALSRTESIYLEELTKVEDSTEGLTAFLEKRKPVWKDR
ncbi:MAG: enoyl-CoA hydratase/isomerase family protein, partial [Candidatus Glassbacteria bacterium]